MDRNDSLTPPEKENTNRRTVVISILIVAVLLVADLYVMVHINYVALAVITVLLLVSVYFFINAILKEIQEGKEQADAQYDMIFKSEKASYLLLKKALEQLNEIDANTKSPANDLIAAQKAIAKVTITRNKENADALMNSNDRLLDQVLQFEERIDENQKELLNKQQGMLNDSVKEIMTRQEELVTGLKELQDSVKSNLTQTIDSIQGMKNDLTEQNAKTQEQVMAAAAQIKNIPAQMSVVEKEPMVGELPMTEEEPAIEESGLDFGIDSLDFGMNGLDLDETDGKSELNLAESLGETESIDFIEDFEETEPKEDLSFLDNMDLEAELDSGEINQEDDINLADGLDVAADGLDIGTDDLDFGTDSLGFEEGGSDLGTDNLGLEEDSLDFSEDKLELEEDSLGLEEDGLASEVDNSNVIPMTPPESAEKEEEVKQDLSDPHKLMTPDEIAALIASM